MTPKREVSNVIDSGSCGPLVYSTGSEFNMRVYNFNTTLVKPCSVIVWNCLGAFCFCSFLHNFD